MALTKIITIGITTAAAVVLLKQVRQELAVVVGLVGTSVIFLMLISGLTTIITSINGLVTKTGLAPQLFASILKIVGIGYLCEIAAGICQDAGAQSVAEMIVLGGKVTILVLAIPIIEALVTVVLGVLN